jgi:hypothetical protein
MLPGMAGRYLGRFREQLILSQLGPLLEEGDSVSAWTHVEDPGSGRHGIVALTTSRVIVHWTTPGGSDVTIPWRQLTAAGVEHTDDGPVLFLDGTHGRTAAKGSMPASGVDSQCGGSGW